MQRDLEQHGYGGNGAGVAACAVASVVEVAVREPLTSAALALLPLRVEWDVSHSEASLAGRVLAKVVWAVGADGLTAGCSVVCVDGHTEAMEVSVATETSFDGSAGVLHADARGGTVWLKVSLAVGADGQAGRLLFARTSVLDGLGIKGGRAEIPTVLSGFRL